MEYERICNEIIIQKNNYYNVHKIEPNEVIIGIELLKLIENHNSYNVNVIVGFGNKTFAGMNITEDYRNKTIIKVGHMEETFIKSL